MTTEQRHTDDDDDPLESERRRKPHARVNNNLLNRPLARDRRVQADWKFSKKRDRWWCNLPGTKYVRLRLPSDAELRLPDGFDVAVLFLILRHARMSKSRKVLFASRAAILRELGVAVRVRHRRRLEQALVLWSQLSTRWREWYRVPQYEYAEKYEDVLGLGGYLGPRVKTKEAERVNLVLPPPIRRVGPLYLVVDQAWLEYSKFESKVDLPLPMRAAVQNLVLALLANPTAKRSLRSWCRTAGLNHKMRTKRLLGNVVWRVSEWFEQHHGVLLQPVLTKVGWGFIRLPKTEGATTRDLRGHFEGLGGPQ